MTGGRRANSQATTCLRPSGCGPERRKLAQPRTLIVTLLPLNQIMWYVCNMGKKVTTSDTEGLLRFIKKNQVATSKELEKYVPARTILGRLVDEGQIQSLGAGVYGTIALDPFIASVIAAARYYPKAIVSNLTAMVIQGLSDERIDRIDVDIERNASIRNKLLKVHRVVASRLAGVEKLKFHGSTIRIYDRERSLCEAYLIDEGGPLFFKALKRYLKKQKPDFGSILKYDNALKTQVLRHVQQELADA